MLWMVGRKEGSLDPCDLRKKRKAPCDYFLWNLFVLSDDSTCLLATLSKDISCSLAHKMLRY